jgi:hypothetical protein
MSQLQDTIKQITDPTVADAKAQFDQMISDGKADSRAFIQASAEQLEQWVLAVQRKQMSQDDFNELVAAQTIVAKNFVLSQTLDAQKRAEELTIGVMKLAATKIVPLLLAAV